jgi:hypothetical protein
LVDETVGGKTVWVGDVEVFALSGHRKAKRCYAWSRRERKNDQDERFVTMLEIPPVSSPETAVKVAISAEVKGKKWMPESGNYCVFGSAFFPGFPCCFG